MEERKKTPDANLHFEESVLLPDSSESGESAHYPLLDMESDDESPKPKLHPTTSVSASPFHLGKYQEPSPPSHVASVSGSMSFLSTMEGWFHGIPDLFYGTILKEAASPEIAGKIKAKAVELLSQPDEAQKNIFEQIEGISDPVLKQALRYSYEIYSCVLALCCMAHDKIAMAFINMLKKLLNHYVGFVKGLEDAPPDEGGFHSRGLLTELVEMLQISFEKSFVDRGFKTVGQDTCRTAGEKTIEKYCEWLKKNGVFVEPPLIASMISRAAAKSVLTQCEEEIREMYISDMGVAEQRFYREIIESDGILPDSTPVLDKKKLVGSFGLSKIDASPLPNYDAVFLCLQGQEVIFPSISHPLVVKPNTPHATLKGHTPQRKQTFSLKRSSLESEPGILSDEIPELLVKFNVCDSSKDDWVLHLGANRANKSIPIPHLSRGIAFLTCVPFFDIDKVDSHFFEILKKQHNNPFFKPLQLTYMPTALFESMVKNPNTREMLIEDFEMRLTPFLSKTATTAKSQADALELEYVRPTVYSRVTKDRVPQTLVSVTAGTFSNDTSSAIISRVKSEIFNSAARGRTSAAGCIKQAASDFCYMGQNMSDDALQREVESSGLLVVATSAANKEFGDIAKWEELLKAMAVIQRPFVTCFSTGDHMAGVAAAAAGLRVCTYGATVIVRTPVGAVNEKLTNEIRGTIAEFQAKMILLDEKKGENYLYKKIQSWFTEYRSKVKSSIKGAVEQLKGSRAVIAFELLPALLTYMYKLEKFDDDDYLVTQRRFNDIVQTKLNTKTHLATQSEIDFISLVVNQEKLREVMEFDGLLTMASEKLEFVTPTGARLKTDVLMPFVKNEIEKLCKCNGSFTTHSGNVFTIDESKATEYAIDRLEEIFIKLPLFSLLQRYELFISQEAIRVNFKDASITVSMPNMKTALDAAVKKLLKADILKNTKRREYRLVCVTHAESIFGPLQIDTRTEEEREFLQAYGSVERGEDQARTLTQELVLDRDCLVMAGSIDAEANPKRQVVDEEVNEILKKLRKQEQEQKEAAAAAAAAASISRVQKLTAPKSQQQKDRDALNRAQHQQTRNGKGRGGKGGGTRKKSKIQKRKITRKYKGKNSRHNHTIKNRNIRNYSLRNKQ